MVAARSKLAAETIHKRGQPDRPVGVLEAIAGENAGASTQRQLGRGRRRANADGALYNQVVLAGVGVCIVVRDQNPARFQPRGALQSRRVEQEKITIQFRISSAGVEAGAAPRLKRETAANVKSGGGAGRL